MKVKLDKVNDIAYINFLDNVVAGIVKETVECESEFGTVLYLDFDANGVLVGIESLMASKNFPEQLLDEAEDY